jgi:DNA-binding IclR family transcriptional regulator
MKHLRNYTAPALEKGLEVLELLAETGRPMTMAQISAELGRSKNELYRMLAVLEERNYLAREKGSEYFHITNRLFDLGMSVPPVGTLVEAAFPVMHELAYTTKQPCHLAVASAHRMVVVARVESPSSVGLSVRVGHSLNLFESGSGYILLAWMPEREKSAAYAYFAEHCEHFSGRPSEDDLEAIRRQEYLRVESTQAQGVEDIACPVFIGERKHAIASLTVPYLRGPGAPFSAENVLEHLREAAARLSDLAGSYGGF